MIFHRMVSQAVNLKSSEVLERPKLQVKSLGMPYYNFVVSGFTHKKIPLLEIGFV